MDGPVQDQERAVVSPHATKVQFAPCQRPTSSMVIEVPIAYAAMASPHPESFIHPIFRDSG